MPRRSPFYVNQDRPTKRSQRENQDGSWRTYDSAPYGGLTRDGVDTDRLHKDRVMRYGVRKDESLDPHSGSLNWQAPPASQTPVHVGVGGQSSVNLPSLKSNIGYSIKPSGDSDREDDPFHPSHRTVCYTDATDPTIPAYLGSVSPGREVSGVTNVKGSGYGPEKGGAAPEGMKHTLLGSYAVDGGRFNYWVVSDGNANHVYRVDLQAPGNDASHIDSFPHAPGSCLHYDQTTTDWRLFRVGRDQTEQKTYPGNAGDSYRAAHDHLRRMAQDHAPMSSQVQQAKLFNSMNTPRQHAAMNKDRRIGSGAPSPAELNARAKAHWKDKGSF